MRKFIIDISIMFVIFILMNIVFYKFITHQILYKDYEVLQENLANHTSYNKFIISDSHGWKLTQDFPENREKFKQNGILNLSYGSESYGDCLIKLHWLLKKKVKIDTILLTVDDHMLTKKSNNSERSIYYSNRKLHQKVYGISFPKYIYYSISRYFPIINTSNQELISKYFEGKFKNTVTKSKINSNWESNNYEEKKKMIDDRISVFFPKDNYLPDNRLVSNLKEIISICKSNNIVIIGVKYPIDVMLIKEFNRLNALNQVKNKAQELGMNIFFDYQNRFNDPAYLDNQDHVNSLGADSLTNAILSDLGY